jgi:hypothetical protein
MAPQQPTVEHLLLLETSVVALLQISDREPTVCPHVVLVLMLADHPHQILEDRVSCSHLQMFEVALAEMLVGSVM